MNLRTQRVLYHDLLILFNYHDLHITFHFQQYKQQCHVGKDKDCVTFPGVVAWVAPVLTLRAYQQVF